MATLSNSERSYESDFVPADSNAGVSPNEPDRRSKKLDQTLRLLFPEIREENEEEETLPISSGTSFDITETQMTVDGKETEEGTGPNSEKKLRVLMGRLNPIPFVPCKIPYFARHEKVLKELGLWDFAHMDLDRNIRVDLMAQLVATYSAGSQDSYVNGYCVKVCRTELGRALNLPVKKKGRVDVVAYSEDLIEFLVEFVTDWVLLHGDEWLMPNEVMEWLEEVKDGRPEKVDWSGLVWFMVEKELTQGEQLRDCYYASHLQRLIKWHHEELFLRENTFEMDTTVKGDEYGVNEGDAKVGGTVIDEMEGCVDGIQSVELMQVECDGKKVGGVEDAENFEMCMEGGDNKELCGKSNLVQTISVEKDGGASGLEDRKVVAEEMVEGGEPEEEAQAGFRAFSSGNNLTCNLVETMEGCKVACGLHGQFENSSSLDDISADIEHIASAQKGTVVEHDDDICPLSLDNSNKRSRINNSMEQDKPIYFELIKKLTERVSIVYGEKDLVLQQKTTNKQILQNEIRKRDAFLQHLQKIKSDEIHKKNFTIYRLERELHLMGGVLDAYKKALKDTQKEFAEYRQRAQLPEKPPYKDAGLC